MFDTTTVAARLLPARTPTELLAAARGGLDEARANPLPGMRYAAAHLAALRAAAAVVADRTTPTPGRPTRIPGVWELLAQVAPELDGWAGYFTDRSAKSAALQSGIPYTVTAVEADDALSTAEQFVALTETAVTR